MIEPGGGLPVSRPNAGLAIASLVTGITSLLCCGLLTGIPAIVMGVLARNKIARSAGVLRGAGMGLAGVILGIAGSAFWTLVLVAGVVVYFLNASHTATGTAIPCDLLEHTVYHYHAAVQIYDEGTELPIPTDVGRPGTCYYWLHMHAASPGVIHVESPDQRTFTLGDFFDVWAKTSTQPIRLDSRHVGNMDLSVGQTLMVFVDGVRYDQDPRGILLVSHRVIQLEITPPTIEPPPTFKFQSGL